MNDKPLLSGLDSATAIAFPDGGDYPTFRRLLRESDCRRCELAAGRTNIVVDRGEAAARIVIVGEGPGAHEDERGEAFVGRAGKLLDRVMAEAGFDTARDTLILNVVKCRPPGNRPPRPKEVEACLPYLRHQLDLVDPVAVLLLGATASRWLFPQRKALPMADQVGRLFTSSERPGTHFMVLYHPAYLLRDPRRVPEMGRHLAGFRAWWDSAASHV